MKWLLLIWCIIFLNNQGLYAQEQGCTDPQAFNFISGAVKNDGSCLYNPDTLVPATTITLPNTLPELSGMVYWQGFYWGHNDGGNGPWLYAIDTTTGAIKKTIGFEGIKNIDWEDIAQDSNHFYIGDFGNNANGNRTDLKIIVVSKAIIIAALDSAILNENLFSIIYFQYPDQLEFTPTLGNMTRYDCEAMFYHRGRLHLVTKNWIGDYSVHYSLPKEAGTYIAERHDSLKTDGFLVTGADIGAEDQIILTAYNANGSCRLILIYGFGTGSNYFETGNKRWIKLPSALSMGQLEAVCYINGIRGAMGSERFSFSNIIILQNICSFNTSNWVIDHYKNNPPYSIIKGMLRYNNETNFLDYFDGADWKVLSPN
jgi:hypothetical protein